MMSKMLLGETQTDLATAMRNFFALEHYTEQGKTAASAFWNVCCHASTGVKARIRLLVENQVKTG